LPLYEYQCRKCGHRFERIQKFGAGPLRKCPACKTGKLTKLPSAPAVQFKGTGWYVTDYARKGSTTTPPAHSEGQGKDSQKKGTETKEAGKSDTGKGTAAAPDGGKKSDKT
jgi:putative FmdB family regulatory protein